MKVLLYTESEKTVGKSGLGKAIKHQMKALEKAKVDYTRDEKDDYDILHINTYFLKSYLLAKKAKKQGKKIVYHAHSTEEDFRNSFMFSNQLAPLFKKWIVHCYNLGDGIVTPTPYSKRLLEGYGIKKPIYAISNGIELSAFRRDKKLGEEFRKKYHIKKGEKVIIGIGIYIERKGIVDFIDLARRMPQHKFIWIGYSPLSLSNKKVKKAFKRIPSNLTMAGYVENDILRGAMSGCDLYLFPTLEENEGIPIIEACASETDAIIRDIPVFEDWSEDGVNVYKAKDIDDFEQKIEDFFSGKLKSLTKEAKKVAEERSLENVGEQLKKLYESLYQ